MIFYEIHIFNGYLFILVLLAYQFTFSFMFYIVRKKRQTSFLLRGKRRKYKSIIISTQKSILKNIKMEQDN